ncbi:hypothetical protein I503_06100 [Candida albicans SC5314]|nr:hypothetical protein I503_06100 [Candida albicans SC5314]
MPSIEQQLEDQELYLKDIEQKIFQTLSKINKTTLENDNDFRKQFEEIPQDSNTTESNNLTDLTITELNNKFEIVTDNLQQLNELQEINSKLKEIETYLGKPKTLQSILDLQYLNNLFKQIIIDTNSQYIIYKQIKKRVDSLYENFVNQLNEYLTILLIPDPLTITNIAILQDFNRFLLKNGHNNMNAYDKYKENWDKLVDSILGDSTPTPSKQLSLIVDELEDTIKLEIVSDNEDNNFIKSITNLIRFINELQYPIIKNYLNSKISKNLIDKISININQIINDKQQLNDLDELVKLCHETNWNILSRMEGIGNGGDDSLQEKLNKLHLDWIVDNYVDKIKKIYKSDAIKQTELIDFYSGKLEKQEEKPTKDDNDEDDGWNDNWDDGWEEEEEAEANPSGKVPDRDTSSEKIVITKIPFELLKLINEFSKYSSDLNYLITSIQALSTIEYPSLANSFLLLNDLNYLSSKLTSLHGDDNDDDAQKLIQFVNCNWNQVLIKFYSELKIVLSSLNLENDESLSNSDELDDYNLNQLSLIYKWFNILFEEKQLKSTNRPKFILLVIDLVEFINNWLIQMIFNLDDISEFQCTKITHIIDNINNVTIPYIQELGINKSSSSIESYDKLNNVKFLINNHLKDIMERFYQGELFNLETQELVNMIKSIFIQSELRDNYIQEIIEFRNMS